MKICLVGGSPNWVNAPFDSDFQIWVHGNQLDRFEGKRVDRIFEIHDDLSEHDDHYPEWISGFNLPTIVGKKFPVKADHIKVFPFEEATKLIGGHLTSTPAYMMALAILESATEIQIHGVDMAVDDHEYFYQRPSMYAWIGYAKGLGIKVDVFEKSPLFHDSYVEGVDQGGKPDFKKEPFTEEAFLLCKKTHQQKINEYNRQISQLETLIHTHNGCLQTYERLAKVARGVEAGQNLTLTDSMVIK